MSEFTNHQENRNKRLYSFCLRILKSEKPLDAVRKYEKLMETVTAGEVIWVVDELVKQNIPMPELKSGINKILNLFYKSLNNKQDIKLPDNSFLYYLRLNNNELDVRLKILRPLIKQVNKEQKNRELVNLLIENFKELQLFDHHYTIKENILFPALEKQWKDFRCVQVMWSFHDDIRRNLKEVISILSLKNLDIHQFNKLVGTIFFNMSAIKFREEKILFPQIVNTIDQKIHDQMLNESFDFNWPFVKPKTNKSNKTGKSVKLEEGEIDLKTGLLFPDQIRWMLNHLPVDITYVDENNKVRYFSNPKKRIFPRSKAIIGRDVKNCHPPESVHVVEKIIEEFKKGNKEKADFWIKMKNEFVLIQYFAIRDENGKYKGVIEVSQEVSEIKALEGEKRLLDWE
jgi:hypothetical protein